MRVPSTEGAIRRYGSRMSEVVSGVRCSVSIWLASACCTMKMPDLARSWMASAGAASSQSSDSASDANSPRSSRSMATTRSSECVALSLTVLLDTLLATLSG